MNSNQPGLRIRDGQIPWETSKAGLQSQTRRRASRFTSVNFEIYCQRAQANRDEVTKSSLSVLVSSKVLPIPPLVHNVYEFDPRRSRSHKTTKKQITYREMAEDILKFGMFHVHPHYSKHAATRCATSVFRWHLFVKTRTISLPFRNVLSLTNVVRPLINLPIQASGGIVNFPRSSYCIRSA